MPLRPATFRLLRARSLALAALLGATATATALAPAARGADLVVDLTQGNSPYSFGGIAFYDNVYVGRATTGTLNQTAGLLNVAASGQLFIGANANSTGTYNLSGGILDTASTDVGDFGAGTFTLTGGAHNVTGTDGSANGSLDIGFYGGSRGTYNLSGGTLSAGYVRGGAGTSTFNFNGGTLQARQSTTGFLQGLTHAYVGSGGAVLDTAGFNVTVGQGLEHFTISGTTGPADGGLTKSGSGTLTLTGASTYTGATVVSVGTLAVAGSVNGGGGATLTVDGTGSVVPTLNLSGTLSAGTVYVGKNNVGAVSQSGGSLTTNGNELVLGNSLFSSGSYTLGGGTLATGVLTVGNTGVNNTFTQGGGSLNPAVMVVGNNGTGTFTQTGGNGMIGTGSFTGSDNGNLLLGRQGSGAGTYNLSGTGNLTVNSIFVGNGGSGTVNQSGGRLGVSTGLSLGSLAGASGVYNLSGGSLGALLALIGDGGTGTFNQSGGNSNTLAVILGDQPGSRGTYHFNGGMLTAYGVAGGSGTSTFNFNGGTLVPGRDSTTFFQGLTTANVRAGGAIINTANAADMTSYNVTIAQPLLHDTTAGAAAVDGGLTKLGAGILTLTAANTYTGDTAVNAGTLLAANAAAGGSATGTGRVSVANGATLGGNGRLAGRVDLSGGATLAPGLAGPGRLTLGGDLNLNNRSTLALELGGTTAGSGYDQVVVGGRLVLGGDLSVSVVGGFALAVGQNFDILLDGGSGLVSGTFANATGNGNTLYTDARGDTFTVNYAFNADNGTVANDVRLTVASVAVVPEPGTWTLLLLAAGGALTRRLVGGRRRGSSGRAFPEPGCGGTTRRPGARRPGRHPPGRRGGGSSSRREPWIQRHAAVHEHRLAGHVVALVAGQPDRRAADVGGLADAAVGDQGEQAF